MTRFASRTRTAPPEEITPGLALVSLGFVNAYLVGEPGGAWVLVDTGLPNTAGRIVAAAQARYGAGARPTAIVLTHGHPDHVGGAKALTGRWDVPVYAHPLEMPFLEGRSVYPPPDPRTGGPLALALRLLPARPPGLGNRLRPLPEDGSVPGLPGWRWVHTPGHSPGHVSLFRETDRALVAGDAFTTMPLAFPPRRAAPQVAPPARFLTPDMAAALESVGRLASLEPEVAGVGHGSPVRGEALRRGLRAAAAQG